MNWSCRTGLPANEPVLGADKEFVCVQMLGYFSLDMPLHQLSAD
jgi:hypothetical protein